MEKNFIIYGAYGYTGTLITELAVSKGLKPLLVGRSDQKLSSLANLHNLPYKVSDVKNLNLLNDIIGDYSLILNCAGPFSETAHQVIEYCIEKKLHYTDITGEIGVFEMAKTFHQDGIDKNIMIMPGTGFDVVPTDCLDKYLSEKLPDSTDLELAFKGVGGPSRGTSITMISGMDKGGAIRKNGKITSVPNAYEVKKFDFDKPNLTAVTIPWGDVSTAFYSTGIPNIKVFMAMSPKMIKNLKLTNYIKGILGLSFVKNFLKSQVKEGGPSEDVRAQANSYIVGKVSNEKGASIMAKLKTIEAYTLTAETALNIAQKILEGNFKAGYQTPSSAYGYQLILEIRGSELSDVLS